MGKAAILLLWVFALISTLAVGSEPPPPKLKPAVEPPSGKGDPERPRAWHLDKIDVERAWRTTKGNRRTTIAIVDSGIQYNHPDLAPNLKRKPAESVANGQDDDGNGFTDDVIGWDFFLGARLPFDRSGHGTFLAGLAAAVEDNGIGGAGVCPKCSILPVRFLNGEGLGDTEDAIRGLHYAVTEGAGVINFSFSGEGYDRDLERAIELAGLNDVVVVVAASNDGENLDEQSTYPAKFLFPHMVTVTASDEEDALGDGANWGRKHVAFAAPGVDVVGPWFDEWDTGSGTSNATAIAAGAAGLVRSANPRLAAPEICRILKATTRRSSKMKKKTQTEGVLDVGAAVRCATSPELECLRSSR